MERSHRSQAGADPCACGMAPHPAARVACKSMGSNAREESAWGLEKPALHLEHLPYQALRAQATHVPRDPSRGDRHALQDEPPQQVAHLCLVAVMMRQKPSISSEWGRSSTNVSGSTSRIVPAATSALMYASSVQGKSTSTTPPGLSTHEIAAMVRWILARSACWRAEVLTTASKVASGH